jgi:Uma2 family endonuclease
MVNRASLKPITLKDIQDAEARGIVREIVNGQWVNEEDRMAGELHGAIAANLLIRLGTFVRGRKLGRVYPADTTYILEENDQGVQLLRLPDVSFVAASRVKTEDRESFYRLAPDLAIKIISPSERAVDIRAKLRDYLRTGVRQVWLVYPETQEVVVHHASGDVKTYERGQTVPGGDLLPDFELPVADIFDV